jgi:DNA-binding CsgD family transcriptional regulator
MTFSDGARKLLEMGLETAEGKNGEHRRPSPTTSPATLRAPAALDLWYGAIGPIQLSLASRQSLCGFQSLDVLADLFGLTPAEASVAARIGAERSLAEIAADRSVKTETARAHLKSAFGKTGARGQAQLVALLTRLAVFTPCGEWWASPTSTFFTSVCLCHNYTIAYQYTIARRTTKMFSFRGSFILLLAIAVGEARGQTASAPEPTTPAETASAIAHTITIDANARRIPYAPVAFEFAISHDNFVEVRYAAKDARFFPQNKAEADRRRRGLVVYFCFNRKIALFQKNDIIIHFVATSDDGVPFEFTVNQSTCANLMAEARTLLEMVGREHSESAEPVRAPNSRTEPKRVHTMTIRIDEDDQKRNESPQSLTVPNRWSNLEMFAQ